MKEKSNMGSLSYRRLDPVASCLGCNCNDFRACAGGCKWLRVDYNAGVGVCTSCESLVPAWDQGLLLSSLVTVGAVLEFPLHRLRVVATDFERAPGFPDAVAQVVLHEVVSDLAKPGTHIATPWGLVQVVQHDQVQKITGAGVPNP